MICVLGSTIQYTPVNQSSSLIQHFVGNFAFLIHNVRLFIADARIKQHIEHFVSVGPAIEALHLYFVLLQKDLFDRSFVIT